MYPVGTARLHCFDQGREWIVEGGSYLSVKPDCQHLHIAGPNGEPVSFALEVPGVLRRSYLGTLDVLGNGEVVRPVVTMGCEVAVGSVVGAELPVSKARGEAMAAQAVVSRSILMASSGGRHSIADFCDTTHCQFLRAPALAGSPAWHATRKTASFVLQQDGRRMSPRFSAACGGHTEAGFNGADRYVSIRCDGCRKEGRRRQGHGWGLCQRGAMAMASDGFCWQAILNKYLPNATVAKC